MFRISYARNLRYFSTSSTVAPPFKPIDPKSIRSNDRVDETRSAAQVVDAVPGVGSFLSDVYKTTGIGLGATIGTSLALGYTTVPLTMPTECLIGGGIGSLVSIGAISMIQPSYHSKPTNEAFRYSINPLSRHVAYGSLSVSTGIFLSPLILSIHGTNVLPMSLLLTTGVLGGCSVYALKSPLGAMSKWRAPLYGSVFGLLGIGLGSIGAHYLGHDQLAGMLHDANTYLGVVIFSGLTAYETQAAIQMYLSGRPDHVMVATQLHTNFINMLIRIIQILKRSR